MANFDKFCQSCGMPMDQDPEQGGTNQDGTKNTKYCSYCFRNGMFTDNFTESNQMVEFVKEKLKEQGHNRIMRWFYTSHIPRLERWNKE